MPCKFQIVQSLGIWSVFPLLNTSAWLDVYEHSIVLMCQSGHYSAKTGHHKLNRHQALNRAPLCYTADLQCKLALLHSKRNHELEDTKRHMALRGNTARSMHKRKPIAPKVLNEWWLLFLWSIRRKEWALLLGTDDGSGQSIMRELLIVLDRDWTWRVLDFFCLFFFFFFFFFFSL